MEILLVSPQKILFKAEAKSVSMRGANGDMQLLSHHAPLLCELSEGDVVIETGSEAKEFKISSGFAEVHDNSATLLVREAVKDSL
ncbi:MAG: F0F1 ATP synthase subunit epsilon [Candidatus Omnitrophica bacterium]|nr:F0F1 ATP synthase subunit epsilon [Candidatus Omnitrophota bacterium]